MIYIPSKDIRFPDLHADTLGFTFIWQGHFLRGIYPESVELAKSYFETGFLDEVVNKKLFPRTWVSEFENEQFGMILEHEMISPILYATEWNVVMLKAAALMVLEIAEVGWRHGYNMIDCHKLNVMFKGTRPLYVDLGSFVPKETGMTGWHPYTNFMTSYYYILDIWTSGAGQIAKRMMSPGVALNAKDWCVYKYPIYRHHPRLVSLRETFVSYMCYLSSVSPERIIAHLKQPLSSPKAKLIKFLSQLVNTLKLAPSQHLSRLRRQITKMPISVVDSSVGQNVSVKEGKKDKIGDLLKYASITFINSPIERTLEICDQIMEIKNIISIQEDVKISNTEYQYVSHLGRNNITLVSFFLMNGGFLIKGKFPEPRLSSDISVVLDYQLPLGAFGLHNAMIFFDRCKEYSRTGHLVVNIPCCPEESRRQLLESYFTEVHGDTFVC